MHETSDVAPTATEYLPVTQSVHASRPDTLLYFPETHRVHVPPSCPDDPALQVQADKAELPAVESELDGHSRQAASVVRAVVHVSRYRPAGHAEISTSTPALIEM